MTDDWDPIEVADLLRSLSKRGVKITLVGGRVQVEDPAGLLKPADRVQLRTRREDLRRHLRGENVTGLRWDASGVGYRYLVGPPPPEPRQQYAEL